MDLWYAHQGTTVYMLTKLPEGATREVGYNDSGWTTYEKCSAEQIKKFYLMYAKWKLVLDLGAGEGDATKRGWPIGPDDFDTMLTAKTFTNGADQDAVKTLFRKMSTNQLGGIKRLDFDGMPAPSTIDARQLGGCLGLCVNLEGLDLRNVQMSAEAATALFSNLAKGALAQLQLLSLSENSIGDAGVTTLTSACANGALAQLKTLGLDNTRTGDAGVTALATVCANGALAQLRTLYLSFNKIGDAGLTALASACANGALAQLETLNLGYSPASQQSKDALKTALNKTQCTVRF